MPTARCARPALCATASRAGQRTAACAPLTRLAVVVNWLHRHQVRKDFSHSCLWILYHQIFHNDLKFATDGQQNLTSHEEGTGTAY